MTPEQLTRYRNFVASGRWDDWQRDPTDSYPGDIWPTRGPQAVSWCETFLVHGPGPIQGRPFRLRADLVEWFARWFEYDPHTGDWRYTEALKGEARGGAKTETAGALAALELCGPRELRSDFSDAPDIAVVAASFENAGVLFGVCQRMFGGQGKVHETPLSQFVDVFDTEIVRKDGAGRIVRVAAVGGTNEGGRLSLLVGDEIHELHGNRERVWTVLSTSLQKRTPVGRSVAITTAGAGRGDIPARITDPLAWRLYVDGLTQRSNPTHKPYFLFDWREADEGLDPNDPADIEKGIRQASGAADIIWRVTDRVRRFQDRSIPQHEHVRYLWNRWVRVAADSWLADHPGAWADCEDRALEPPPDGADVWLGVDASWHGDATALALVWPRDDGRVGWSARTWIDAHGRGIPFDELERAIGTYHDTHRVRALVFDPRFMAPIAARAEAELDMVAIEVPQSLQRRAKIDEHARQAIVSGVVAHNGDPVLTEHVLGAAWKESDSGRVLSKRRSGGHIDALVACAMAHWYATAPEAEATPQRAAPFVFFGN